MIHKKKFLPFFMVGLLITVVFLKVIWKDSIIKAINTLEPNEIRLNLSNNWNSDKENPCVDINWSTDLNIEKDKYKLFRKIEGEDWKNITSEMDIASETNDTSYTKKKTFNYFSQDLSVYDDVAPELPNVEIESDDDQFYVTMLTKDKGKEYQWYISGEQDGKELKSSVKKIEVTSGIKGYIYVVDDLSTTEPTVERDISGDIVNIMLEESVFNLTKSENKWLHIIAVDSKNNVSDVKHMELKETNSDQNKVSNFDNISNRSSEAISFAIERTADTSKLVNLALDTTKLSDMKSIEILMPSNTSIVNYANMTLPTYWSKFQNSDIDNMKSTTFSMESTVNGKVQVNNSISTIRNFLNGLSFSMNNPTNQSGKIKIIFHKLAYASWTDPKDQKRHYYAYIPPVGTSYLNWMQAYNAAKKMEYKGLKGYLATLTSYEEHYFVYDRIAKNSGWLGGARIIKSNGQKINDELSIATAPSNYNYNVSTARNWYWVDGPEAGLVFLNNATYAGGGRPPKSVYQGFNNPLNAASGGTGAEPNNSSGNECVLEFAQASSNKRTMLWNDLSLTNTSYKSGFYVEFSEYGSQKEIEEKTDILGSADIPQKIVITGYDQDGNKMPTSSNRLYDQKLLIGSKVTILPESFPMYDFIKLTDSEGSELASLELEVSNNEQNNKLLYSLRKAIVNVRQVVVNQNSEIILPNQGFARLTSESSTSSGNARDDRPISMKSSNNNNASFESNVIRYDMGQPMYKLIATIPMNYKLVGYQTTTTKQVHTLAASNLIPALVDVTKNPEFWVTVYIEPVTKNPTQYNWEYKKNNLSTIKIQ